MLDVYVATEAELRDEVLRLQAEIARLGHVEALKDIAEGEARIARNALNEERVKRVNLQEQLEAIVTDMSLMEDRIRELSGIDPDAGDYGP